MGETLLVPLIVLEDTAVLSMMVERAASSLGIMRLTNRINFAYQRRSCARIGPSYELIVMWLFVDCRCVDLGRGCVNLHSKKSATARDGPCLASLVEQPLLSRFVISETHTICIVVTVISIR